jgi:hypothetical protein
LSKAYDGNTNALGKLGLGLDQSVIKSKDFDKVYTALRDNFRGFAEQEANTFEGKLRRLQVAFDEGKETVGAYILDAITPLVTLSVDKLIPAFESMSETLGKVLGPALTSIFDFLKELFIPMWNTLKESFDKVKSAITDNKENLQPLLDLFYDLWIFVKDNIVPILGTVLVSTVKNAATAIAAAIRVVSPIIEAVTGAIRTAINIAIDGINLLIAAYNRVNNLFGGSDISPLSKLGASSGAGGFSGTKPDGTLFGSNGGSTGGGSTGGGSTGGGSTGGGSTGGGSTGGGSTGGNRGGGGNGSNVVLGNFNPGRFREGEAKSLGDLLGGGSGGSFDAGRFRQGESNSMRSPMPPNNVLINIGVVGDPAGAARTIKELLDNEATNSGNFLNGIGNSRFAVNPV